MSASNKGMVDFQWFKNPPPKTKTKSSNIIVHLPGPKGAAKSVKSVEEAFDLFFDPYVMQILIDNANIYVQLIKDKFEREEDARPGTLIEMKVFVSFLFASGVTRAAYLNSEDMFNDKDFSAALFHTTMSSKRFLFIPRRLRFDDINTRLQRSQDDKLAPIRALYEDIVKNCKKFYAQRVCDN